MGTRRLPVKKSCLARTARQPLSLSFARVRPLTSHYRPTTDPLLSQCRASIDPCCCTARSGQKEKPQTCGRRGESRGVVTGVVVGRVPCSTTCRHRVPGTSYSPTGYFCGRVDAQQRRRCAHAASIALVLLQFKPQRGGLLNADGKGVCPSGDSVHDAHAAGGGERTLRCATAPPRCARSPGLAAPRTRAYAPTRPS